MESKIIGYFQLSEIQAYVTGLGMTQDEVIIKLAKERFRLTKNQVSDELVYTLKPNNIYEIKLEK
jgi:hypothetical protein